jgi:multisubunit Na+/H+ antiporter MnhB subunit
MHDLAFHQALLVAAVALLVALLNGYRGIRSRHCDPTWARSNFVVALVAFAIAVVVLLRVISPVVGYSLVCLALAGFQLADLLQDERERAQQRRVALLAPRPTAEVAPTVWVALAVASVLPLTPYVLLNEERAAAAIVGICALVMAAIAWRIASAPVMLYGEDVESERRRDRSSRTRKAGVTAVIAMGSVMVFISFVNYNLPAVLPLQRTLLGVSSWTWALSGASVFLYSLYLGRLRDSTS